MAVNLVAPEYLIPVAGARWATAEAAIKKPGRRDLALLVLPDSASVAGVFTQNVFAAAPVQIARQHLGESPRALLINSGNANAGTGVRGEADANACCSAVADLLGLANTQVLPFSTGVIGQPLPMERMTAAIACLGDDLREDAWQDAATSIMTTDTVAKGASRTLELTDGQRVVITGIAKGSGMICPNMATMLGFIATDAAISQADLQAALAQANQASFNSITVDGDTSTNDACMACATGVGPNLSVEHVDWTRFVATLTELARELACAVVRDGEGATRFIELSVSGAANVAEARAVAFTVAHSPLVKTACFAGDPNWGRILAAIGRAPVQELRIEGVSIALNDVAIVAAGQPRDDYLETDAAAVMAESEFTIHIGLGRGDAAARIWTSDLSYEYVRINAEYRS